MEQEVYVDLFFIINLSMDYLCLYICARIMKRRINAPRLLLSSAIGALYSSISLFLPISSAIALSLDALICFLICLIAFYEKERNISSVLLCAFLFIGISMTTGGCMTAIFNLLNRLDLPLNEISDDGISTYMFAAVAAVAGAVALRSGQAISKHASVTNCTVTVAVNGKSITLNALSDSGNLVRDPISGRQVILIDRSSLSELVDISIYDSFLSGETHNAPVPRALRLIPINTASGKGMLAASMPDCITISYTDRKGKTLFCHPDAMIAPSDINKSADGYKAIVPSDLLK